jgi:hypothetical protein
MSSAPARPSLFPRAVIRFRNAMAVFTTAINSAGAARARQRRVALMRIESR